MQRQADRVNYSYGFKVPGAEDYSSINASCSFSTDVQDGETPEEAMARAVSFVHSQCEKDLDDALKLRRLTGGDASDEGFSQKGKAKKGKA